MEKSTQIYTIINIKEGFECICISVIMVDSVYKKDNNHYPQEFIFRKSF